MRKCTDLLTAITYSVISPIINGLAFVTFFFFFMLYKYLFLWQLQQPRANDSGGLFFPKAIQHVFVGLYIQQICLAALFFLSQDNNKKQSAIPEGALMVVLIIVTVSRLSHHGIFSCADDCDRDFIDWLPADTQ